MHISRSCYRMLQDFVQMFQRLIMTGSAEFSGNGCEDEVGE